MIFPSPEWFSEWVRCSNSDDEFRAAGQGWEGAVGAVLLDVPGASHPMYLRLEGRDGQWTGHDFGADPGLVEGTRFVLSARYPAWKAVIRQDLDPIRGLITGRLRVRGQLSSVLRWTGAFRVMTRIAGTLRTTFADEDDGQ